MYTREIRESDLKVVSEICVEAFFESVAETLTEEGRSTFLKIADSEAFLNRMKEDNLILVAVSHARVIGVIELKEGRHIAMLFVEPGCQRVGVGRMLLSSVLKSARIDAVTVSSSLPSVPAYRKFGFTSKGRVAESEGLVYQPMEIALNKLRKTDENTI